MGGVWFCPPAHSGRWGKSAVRKLVRGEADRMAPEWSVSGKGRCSLTVNPGGSVYVTLWIEGHRGHFICTYVYTVTHTYTQTGFLEQKQRPSKDNPLSYWIKFYPDLKTSLHRELIHLHFHRRWFFGTALARHTLHKVVSTLERLQALLVMCPQHVALKAQTVFPGIPRGGKVTDCKVSDSPLGKKRCLRETKASG